MKKLIVFEEQEFNAKFQEFVMQLGIDFRKDYGYKVVSRENGEDILEKDPQDYTLGGALMLTWNKVFKEA